MKTNILTCLATLFCVAVSNAGETQRAGYINPSANRSAGAAVSQVGFCDCGEAVCGCEGAVIMQEPAACGCESAPMCGCDGGYEATCGMELACEPGCDDLVSCNGSGGGCGLGGGLGDCPLSSMMGGCGSGDEPFELFGSCGNFSMGGWIQLGYHDENNTLFNNRADELNLHQAWLYAEKAIDTSCGFDIGGRVDYMYGIDSNDTQAFGTDPRGWDNGWDNGLGDAYGQALPQAYMEAGYGDFSVKVGHFFTIIGYEVVTAPDNFFYSHAYTMYNSEPFTHTGALGTYTPSDDVTVWGGYTMGWDSGFDHNGDSFLGGLSFLLCDDVTLTYATTIGDFGALPLGTPEQGYMHSIVADVTLTDKLQYIFHSDLLDSEDDNNNTVRKTFGVNQYMIYSLSDTVSLGGRFEWYNEEGVYGNVGSDNDIYALTVGANYKPCANVIVRPEYRWDFDDNRVVGLADGDEQQTFGIDTIFLF